MNQPKGNELKEPLSDVPSIIKPIAKNTFKQLNLIKKPITPKESPARNTPASKNKDEVQYVHLKKNIFVKKKKMKTPKAMSVVKPARTLTSLSNFGIRPPDVYNTIPPPSEISDPFFQPYRFPSGIPKTFLVQPKDSYHDVYTVPGNGPDHGDALTFDLPSWVMLDTDLQTDSQAMVPTTQCSTNEFAKESNCQGTIMVDNIYTSIDQPQPNMNINHETNVDAMFERQSSDSPDALSSAAHQKRVSAFSRLGPVTLPKRPKLTINLLFSKEQAVREVVDGVSNVVTSEPEEIHQPVHKRQDILDSKDELVIKYLPLWPWAKSLVAHEVLPSQDDQRDTLNDLYRNNIWVKVIARCYPCFPPHVTKEDVLDGIMKNVDDKNFIPCFIEFDKIKCTFLLLRSRNALAQLLNKKLTIDTDTFKLSITLYRVSLSLSHLDLIPRIVLRRRLMLVYDEGKLDLSKFCLQPDLSHFIYFPLNNLTNQSELLEMQSTVQWKYLNTLNLSNNRLTSIKGFQLSVTTPSLHVLDLSNNMLERFSELIDCRGLMLRSLNLDGNPLCLDFINSEEYIEVARLLFPTLMEMDCVPLNPKFGFPVRRKNYCSETAKPIVEKFLEIFFPLLDASPTDRMLISDLYHDNATLSITCKKRLRHSPQYRYMRDLFYRSRDFSDRDFDTLEGSTAITKHILKWPALLHDPFSFTVDLIHHSDSTTILFITGIMKLTSESLAEEEPLVSFARTVVLHSRNGVKYTIRNELISWDVPRDEYADSAFKVTTIKPKQISSKLDSPPDEKLKKQLIEIFMKITNTDRTASEKYLTTKNWDICLSLEYFMNVLKLS